MGLAVFFGCFFIAFGPAFALFVFTVAVEPLRVIILVAGVFFWQVSVLLSSVLWVCAVRLSDQSDAGLQYYLLASGVALCVLLQELSRLVLYSLLKRASQGLATFSGGVKSAPSLEQMAYVSGLAYGMSSGAFCVVNTLAVSLGPGTPGIHGHSQYLFISSAVQCVCALFLHLSWSVLLFLGCERGRWTLGATVVGSHLLASGVSLLNPHYEYSLGVLGMLTLAMALLAWGVAGGSLGRLRCCVCRGQGTGKSFMQISLVFYS
ncbi:APH1A secretase, partial [Amia calva]|nr:APH1A secretase [Amia calva]